MIVQYINGQEYKWSPSSKNRKEKKKSKGHKAIAKAIHKQYPTIIILEEVPIRPLPKKLLYLDFYIPDFMTAIEVQGKQHFKYSAHFHKNKMKFLQSKRNDLLKKEWCSINQIILIELNYKESIEEWMSKIKQTL